MALLGRPLLKIRLTRTGHAAQEFHVVALSASTWICLTRSRVRPISRPEPPPECCSPCPRKPKRGGNHPRCFSRQLGTASYPILVFKVVVCSSSTVVCNVIIRSAYQSSVLSESGPNAMSTMATRSFRPSMRLTSIYRAISSLVSSSVRGS